MGYSRATSRKFVTIDEAAQRCGASHDTIRRRIKNGTLKGCHQEGGTSNGRWLIPLINFVDTEPDTPSTQPASSPHPQLCPPDPCMHCNLADERARSAEAALSRAEATVEVAALRHCRTATDHRRLVVRPHRRSEKRMTSHARRRRSNTRPDVPQDAIKFCWWWWDRTYVKDITSSAQMNRRTEALIKNHIEPWLKELDIGSWHNLHALDVDDLAFKLAGMTSQAANPVPTRLGNADFYTVRGAATLGHCSTSKLKRLSAAGGFPNRKLVLLEGESKERYLIPAADLIANGWDLRHGTPVPDQRTAAAISESSANEILQLLRRICDDAVRTGVLDRNPAHGVQAKTPLESSTRRINRLNRERILESPASNSQATQGTSWGQAFDR
jgi:hypothetical protein